MANRKQATKKPSARKTKETLVVFILDKSGSMGSVRDATISGFNEYVDSLKKQKEVSYRMSLTLFDTTYTKRATSEPLKDIEPLTAKNYVPDGMTALYDAVMRTISDTEKKVKKGEKVLCVMMTDGEENSSKEYTDKDLKTKVKELEKSGNWSFVYLGANQDAWAAGQKFGMQAGNVAAFVATSGGIQQTMQTMAANTRAYSAQATMQTQSFFSQQDQDKLKNSQ